MKSLVKLFILYFLLFLGLTIGYHFGLKEGANPRKVISLFCISPEKLK